MERFYTFFGGVKYVGGEIGICDLTRQSGVMHKKKKKNQRAGCTFQMGRTLPLAGEEIFEGGEKRSWVGHILSHRMLTATYDRANATLRIYTMNHNDVFKVKTKIDMMQHHTWITSLTEMEMMTLDTHKVNFSKILSTNWTLYEVHVQNIRFNTRTLG